VLVLFIQALLLESYQYNPLVRLLLKRALEHKTIGHRLFWHLRYAT